MGKRFSPPADFELQILGVLWEHGSATVRQVMERLPDGKERAYTSVLSVMQVMQKKGLLAVERQEGLAYVYKPKVRREQVVRPLLNGLVDRVFGGSPRVAIQHLLSDRDLDAAEIRELRKLLDDLEARQQS